MNILLTLLNTLILICTLCQNGDTASIPCPAEFQEHDFYPNLCIHVPDSNIIDVMYWAESENYCASYGGTLVMVYNDVIHNYVTSLLNDVNSRHFIGLKGFVANGMIWYRWTDSALLDSSYERFAASPVGLISGVLNWCVFYKTIGSVWYWERADCLFDKGLPICQFLQKTGPTLPVTIVEDVRVEVYYNDRWGTISQTTPTTELGDVICGEFNQDFDLFDNNGPVGTGQTWLLDPCDNDSCIDVHDLDRNHWYYGIALNHDHDVRLRCKDRITVTFSPSFSVTSYDESSLPYICETIYVTNTHTVMTSSNMMCDISQTITQTEYVTVNSPCSEIQTFSDIDLTSTTLMTSYINPTPASPTTLTSQVTVQLSSSYVETPPIKRKNSAMYSSKTRTDNRASAVAIGTLGIGMLAGTFAVLLCFDCLTFVKYLESMKLN